MPQGLPLHRCFGERMTNPFHGVAQVVETPGAEAVSRDGVQWTLYVRGEPQWERREDGGLCRVELPDVRFGKWSRDRGLQRAPVRSILDLGRVEYEGGRLLAILEKAAEQLPFPPADRYERWLLDCSGRPLALLESRVDAPVADDPPPWRIGHLAPERFTAIPALLGAAAGPNPHCRWLERSPEGVGYPLDTESDAAIPLPELPIAETLLPEAARRLIAAYLEWLAPWLLQLHGLSHDVRERLERAAWCNAPQVALCHHLYPEVLDRPRLIAVLVEAELRRADSGTTPAATASAPAALYEDDPK